tara:strand:- start:2363 stop:2584 length:222 start_codon:yes stop_codon:yes gene_type:complete
MSNPFEKYVGGTYANHVFVQIKDLDIGDIIYVDVADKTVTEFRTTLAYVSTKHKLSFKTKTDSKGDVWIHRIA